MNQTDNKNNLSEMLSSLGETSGKVSSFLNALSGSLTPEQKAALDKELGGNDAFQGQMKKAQEDLTKALSDIQKFKHF